MKTFSIRAAIRESYSIIKPLFWKVVGQYALLAAVFIGLDVFSSGNFLLNLILSCMFSYVMVLFGMSYVETGSFSFEDIFRGLSFKKFVFFLLGTLLADLAIFGGFILLLIPGAIMLVQLHFAKYILVTEDIMPLPALKKSARLTKGSRWKLFELMLVMLLINVCGLIVLGVGLFFTVPLTLMAFIIVYKKLAGESMMVEAGEVPLETA